MDVRVYPTQAFQPSKSIANPMAKRHLDCYIGGGVVGGVELEILTFPSQVHQRADASARIP